MSDEIGIDRICFNFENVCNMQCPWCYIPFTGDNIDTDLCLNIIDRCVMLGVKIITFGGGDPLIFPDILRLVEHTAEVGIIVHIDTNAISLRSNHLQILGKYVSVIALPLDGPDSDTHDKVRLRTGHFDIVKNAINMIKSVNIDLKINTIATSQNHSKICEMQELIGWTGARIWSIYQYWPLSYGKKSINLEINDEDFLRIIDMMQNKNYMYDIEANLISERIGTYCFVSHQGGLYTHDDLESGEYMNLGNILDDEAIDRWRQLNRTSLRSTISPRYRIFISK